MPERESNSMALSAWMQVVSSVVGAVAAIVAGWVGWQSLVQSDQNHKEGEIIQTLAFFATFNGPSMIGIRGEVEKEDWCVRYYGGDDHYEMRLTSAEASSFVDFFDTVNMCGQRELCNTDFAQQLFGPYAEEHYDELSRFILNKRTERGPHFGEGMAGLAGSQEPVEQVAQHYAEHSCGQHGAVPPAPATTPSTPAHNSPAPSATP